MFGKKSQPAAGTGPAFEVLDLVVNELNARNLKYDLSDDKPVIFIKFSGDHINGQSFTLIIDDDGESVALRVFSIFKFEAGQLADAYEFCNKVNNQYRWMRFYVDSDDEFTAAIDAVITPSTAGAECVEILGRAVNIVDSVYGELMA